MVAKRNSSMLEFLLETTFLCLAIPYLSLRSTASLQFSYKNTADIRIITSTLGAAVALRKGYA